MSDSYYSLDDVVSQIKQSNLYRYERNNGAMRAGEIESAAISRAKGQAASVDDTVLVTILSAAEEAREAAETAYLAFECLRDTAEAYLSARSKTPTFADDETVFTNARFLERTFQDLSSSLTQAHKEAQSACDYAVLADIHDDEDDADEDDADEGEGTDEDNDCWYRR